MPNETNETPNFRLPEPFYPGSRLTARNMQDWRGAIAFCLQDMIVDGPGILITKTSGGQYIFEARKAGRRVPLGESLTLFEPEDSTGTDPKVGVRSGNFTGRNWDETTFDLSSDDWLYFFGRVKFSYNGEIDPALDPFIAGGAQGPSHIDRQPTFPSFGDAEFSGEAFYYLGKARRVGSSPNFTVEIVPAHRGGNVTFRYSCEGSLIWRRL